MKTNNIYIFLNQKEIQLIRWITKNQFKIVLLLIFSGGFLIASRLPYLNLFIHKSSTLFVALISAILLFQISNKIMTALSLIFLLVSMIALLLKLPLVAIDIANFAVGISFFTLVKLIIAKP